MNGYPPPSWVIIGLILVLALPASAGLGLLAAWLARRVLH